MATDLNIKMVGVESSRNNMTKSQRKQQAKKLDVIQRRHLDHHHYYPSMEIDLYSTRTSIFLARLDFFHLHQIKI